MKKKGDKKFVIGISKIPPFVFNQSSRKLTGFEVDLWENIAKKLDIKFKYKSLTLNKLLAAIREDTVDLGFGGLTRTHEREKLFNFSHFTLRSQLGILMRKHPRIHLVSSISSFLYENRKVLMKVAWFFIVFLFITGHITWFFERGAGTFSTSYFQGIWDVTWWLIVTFSTVGYGDLVPATIIGRVIAVFVIVFGYAAFAVFIAKLSSSITMQHLKRSIEKVSDLNGKIVATKKYSIFEDQLRDIGAHTVTVSDIEKAYDLLDDGKVTAVLFDAPTLITHKKTDAKDRFILIHDVHNEQTYGFAFPDKSPLRGKVNEAILEMYENGEYEDIYQKWFD
jgi:polar amino acid transport system substrate-binding protein